MNWRNWQPYIVGPIIGGIFIVIIIVALALSDKKKPEGRGSPPTTPELIVPKVPHTWTHISGSDGQVKVWRLDYDGKTFILTTSSTNHTIIQVQK